MHMSPLVGAADASRQQIFDFHRQFSQIFTGSSRTRTPVAWWTASVMAAAMPANAISPVPFKSFKRELSSG
jgi:hypothetical protein